MYSTKVSVFYVIVKNKNDPEQNISSFMAGISD